AALGVKETGQVLNLIQQIKEKGLPVILISHNMPNVFEVSDRIHIARLGGCAGVITPKSHTPTEAVAIMTGATTLAQGGSSHPGPISRPPRPEGEGCTGSPSARPSR